MSCLLHVLLVCIGQAAEKCGLVEKLRTLLSDPNAMVVTNAIAGLA